MQQHRVKKSMPGQTSDGQQFDSSGAHTHTGCCGLWRTGLFCSSASCWDSLRVTGFCVFYVGIWCTFCDSLQRWTWFDTCGLWKSFEALCCPKCLFTYRALKEKEVQRRRGEAPERAPFRSLCVLRRWMLEIIAIKEQLLRGPVGCVAPVPPTPTHPPLTA